MRAIVSPYGTGRTASSSAITSDEYRDLATASLIETWIDETERRMWFLFEVSRREMTGGH